MKKNFAIVGVGLIGGSFALKCKKEGLSNRIIGVDNNADHATKAIELGLVDQMTDLASAVEQADVIVLSIPVNALSVMIPSILDLVDQQVVIDMGSTKSHISAVVENHPKRGRFVASHPMWGTEYSGPAAAVENAFENKAVILCDLEKTDEDAILIAKGIFAIKIDHDLHAAYVSHISHITSFALANTVLEKEKEDDAIFEMASAGFESTVRLAKSSPEMWTPILMHNRENVLDVLNEHITQLKKFKACLEKENWEYLNEMMSHANQIKRIIQ